MTLAHVPHTDSEPLDVVIVGAGGAGMRAALPSPMSLPADPSHAESSLRQTLAPAYMKNMPRNSTNIATPRYGCRMRAHCGPPTSAVSQNSAGKQREAGHGSQHEAGDDGPVVGALASAVALQLELFHRGSPCVGLAASAAWSSSLPKANTSAAS